MISALLLFLQALALPTSEDQAGHLTEQLHAAKSVRIRPALSEQAEAFLVEIDSWFVRFQNFYDRQNAQMRTYRLAHVDLVTSVYNQLLTVFGDSIEAVRQSSYELLDLVEERTEGEISECLQGVVDDHTANSQYVSSYIESCAIYANQTFTTLLSTGFYPVFAGIQSSITAVPVAVIDTLARGNILQDEEEILEFLAARYAIIDMQWYSAVSQLLQWESNRFEVDGLFMVDQQTICSASQVLIYIETNAALETRALAC